MTHTHDGIDWATRLAAMRRADEVDAAANRSVAARVVGLVGQGATVVDIGPGAGGMSAALAEAILARGGGRMVLVDAVPELLSAAASRVRQALAAANGRVEIDTLKVDAASGELAGLLPSVDLIWASRVVHHLPDQRKGIDGLVRALRPGGWLVLAEGGLPMRCLPWDVGVGEPGLADRLTAAGDRWFAQMRGTMPGAVRLPVGWNRVLADAGLVEVSSFSYLVDLPAPAPEHVRQSVVDWLTWVGGIAEDHLSASDWQAVRQLLDPADPAYAGARDDVFILRASTVYSGRKAEV
jgi:SAM-dependent methyltransferase